MGQALVTAHFHIMLRIFMTAPAGRTTAALFLRGTFEHTGTERARGSRAHVLHCEHQPPCGTPQSR